MRTAGVADKAPKVPAPVSERGAPRCPDATVCEAANTFQSAQQAVGNLGMQSLLRSGVIRAKLSVSQPEDSDEREADRVADAAVQDGAPALVRRECSTCASGTPCGQCQPTGIRRKVVDDGALPAARSHAPELGFLREGGRPLARDTRRHFEARLGADLGGVRIHQGASVDRATSALAARAFTVGNHIAFASGQLDVSSQRGRHLLAHELAHTLQPSRDASGAEAERLRRQVTCSVAGPPAMDADAERSLQAVRAGDVNTVVAGMRGKGAVELCALRSAVYSSVNQRLERWLMVRRNRPSQGGLLAAALGPALPVPGMAVLGPLLAASTARSNAGAEEGLRLLLPALPLLDHLELYDEGAREIEQAQLDVIRATRLDEREAARSESARLEAIYSRMDIKEEYDARRLIEPEARYRAAERVLQRAPGVFSNEEDLVYDAIWALTPTERRTFYVAKQTALLGLLWAGDRFYTLRALVEGTEAQALIARLRLATEGRRDEQEGVRAVVERAVVLLNEQKRLRATIDVAGLPTEEKAAAQARLLELGELEQLVSYGTGALGSGSFLARLADASPDTFGDTTRRFGATIADPEQQAEYAFRSAKQRILIADDDEDAIRNAIIELRAPPVEVPAGTTPAQREARQANANTALRRRLEQDVEVRSALGRLRGSERMNVLSFVDADAFIERLADLRIARNGARWGEFFQIVLEIARRDDWLARFRNTASDPWSTFASVHGEERTVMLDILEHRRISAKKILAFTGDVDTLRTVLENLDETERSQLRLGYILVRSRRLPQGASEVAAVQAFNQLHERIRSSQSTLVSSDSAGIESVLDAALGSEPTAGEMETGAGRYNAAAILYERQEARLALDTGASAGFTESDETMQAAGRQFAALWLQWRDRNPRELSTVELAALVALYDRFQSRSAEFTEASNTIGEIAGMVAATVAGILVVAATGGVTAPAVIAAAAAGGASRVVTREMFGADYYTAMSAAGGRDAFLGAIDAALAVVGASLGARGAELLGMSGRGLLRNAARMGGEVAEQASTKLLHRVGRGLVESAIDGAFSGFVSEAANALTDARTWRRGIWDGLLRVGQAALVGGLVGLVAGGALGAALPVVGAGFRHAADKILGASVERSLARAGATEALEAARAAVRAGNADEARRLFAELERHLTAEQASLLWRDLARLADGAVRMEQPIMLLGERHTLRLVEGENGAFFVLCSWCTKVQNVLRSALEGVEVGSVRARRLTAMIDQLERMEANIAAGRVSRTAATDANMVSNLLGMLTEGEHLLGTVLSDLPRPRTASFSALARDPAVARRAAELYEGYFEQLWAARRDLFRGKDARGTLNELLEAEAEARALSQAQRDVLGRAPHELPAGAPARTTIDPATDIPFGFFDREGFETFSRRLNAALDARSPKGQLVLEGSGVTGRRFERAVDFAPTGGPFAMGRMSDYDVAIISDALFEEAGRARIPMSKGPVPATNQLSRDAIARLDLGDLDNAARQAILDATGIAYPVKFKIRPSSAAEAATRLPLPRPSP